MMAIPDRANSSGRAQSLSTGDGRRKWERPVLRRLDTSEARSGGHLMTDGMIGSGMDQVKTYGS